MSRADRFAPLDDETRDRWMRFTTAGDRIFPNLLGLEVEDVRVDYCRIRMPFKRDLLQGAGVVHGGAIAALLDAVLVPAVGAVLERGTAYSTVDMHVQYMRANADEDMIAEGWVTRRGRTVVFCESEVATASGKVLARSILTYNVAASRA